MSGESWIVASLDADRVQKATDEAELRRLSSALGTTPSSLSRTTTSFASRPACWNWTRDRRQRRAESAAFVGLGLFRSPGSFPSRIARGAGRVACQARVPGNSRRQGCRRSEPSPRRGLGEAHLRSAHWGTACGRPCCTLGCCSSERTDGTISTQCRHRLPLCVATRTIKNRTSCRTPPKRGTPLQAGNSFGATTWRRQRRSWECISLKAKRTDTTTSLSISTPSSTARWPPLRMVDSLGRRLWIACLRRRPKLLSRAASGLKARTDAGVRTSDAVDLRCPTSPTGRPPLARAVEPWLRHLGNGHVLAQSPSPGEVRKMSMMSWSGRPEELLGHSTVSRGGRPLPSSTDLR